jgi:peptidyl-prolyl cis-trans isomerase SurA
MKNFIPILTFLLFAHPGTAQNTDTLMLIGEDAVSSDEFLRIYNKNSNIAEENQKSVDEYIDLFINYKLKVIEAENLGYDTLSSFIKEMAGYTDQLAKPYLENTQALDSFIAEAYNRQLEEINASHILLKLDKNALPADTARVYNQLVAWREQMLAGKAWSQVIEDESPDKENEIGGDLGWFSAFRMVYPFESGAYNTPAGGISMPVRTDFGYHLIRVNDRRSAQGEVMVSHIMTIVPKEPTELDKTAAREKINKAYAELEDGAAWNDVTEKYSEHRSTYKNGGKLGYIRTGNAPDAILEMAFSLDTFEYSKPFETQYGFHIVRPEKFKPIPEFKEVENDIQSKIRSTSEIVKITREQVQKNIKQEYGFGFFEESLDPVYELADSTMVTGTWDANIASGLTDTVFFIGDSVYSQFDIAQMIAERRITSRSSNLAIPIRQRVMDFIDKSVLAYERSRLSEKYPEYGNLLKEYHDGILLFNLTEDKVWRKAVEDTLGLEKFYNGLEEKYRWEKRIAITRYTYSDSSLTAALIPLAKKRSKNKLSATELAQKLCPQDSTLACIKFVELKYEHGDNAVADSLSWKKGQYLTSKDKNNHVLFMVDDILPAQNKTLKDARGLYTADYQTRLEKEWIKELRAKYPVLVDQEVLAKIKAVN